MFKAVISLCILILLLGAGAAMFNANPVGAQNLVLAIDKFGVTSIGATEKRRLEAINQLKITHAEKQVLVNRTVFIGSTPDMAELALGPPTERTIPANNNRRTILIYRFEQDSLPTFLTYDDGRLVQAEKRSTLTLN